MKYYGHAESSFNRIVEAFETGTIPRAMSHVFINHGAGSVSDGWSWSNRLLVALSGEVEARGKRQWILAGRRISKGAKAIHILAPRFRTVSETDEQSGDETKRQVLYGFGTIPVFGLSQTEPAKPKLLDYMVKTGYLTQAERDSVVPYEQEAAEQRAYVDSLPWVAVAKSWGIDVTTYRGEAKGYLGYYRYGGQSSKIALGVENLATWAHELIHAADHRVVGSLKGGQDWQQEIVAELGGAVMLECAGYVNDSDRGGCWEYVRRYAEKAGKKNVAAACVSLMNRTCKAVALVLEEAAKVAPDPEPEPEPSLPGGGEAEADDDNGDDLEMIEAMGGEQSPPVAVEAEPCGDYDVDYDADDADTTALAVIEPSGPPTAEVHVTRRYAKVMPRGNGNRWAIDAVLVLPSRDDGQVHTAATDGHRLVMATEAGSASGECLMPMEIVPTKAQGDTVRFDGREWRARLAGKVAPLMAGNFPRVDYATPEWSDDGVTIALNARYLAEIAETLGENRVVLHVNADDKRRTIMVQPVDRLDAIGVLMPVEYDAGQVQRAFNSRRTAISRDMQRSREAALRAVEA